MASARPLSGENDSVSEAGSANSVKSWMASRDVLQRRNDHLLQQHQAEVSALMARQQEQSMKLTHELEMSDMEYHNLVDQIPHHPDVITPHVSGDLWTASPPGVHPNMDPTLDTSDVIQPGLIDPSINVPTITPLSQTTPHNPHVSAGQSVHRSPIVVEYATENNNKPDVHTSYTCTGQSTENNGIPLYSTPMNNPFNDRWTASASPAPQHRRAAALQSGYDNVVEYASVNNNETDDVHTSYTCAVQSIGNNGVPLYSTPMNNPFNERWTAPVPLAPQHRWATAPQPGYNNEAGPTSTPPYTLGPEAPPRSWNIRERLSPAAPPPPRYQVQAACEPWYQQTPPQANAPPNNAAPYGNDQRPSIIDVMALTTLPRPEIMEFDSKALNYPRFINNFMSTIANRVTDDRLKLNYLIQYCTGDSRRYIADFVNMPADTGFNMALRTLNTVYGRSHIIAQSYVSELTTGPIVKGNDDIQKLAHSMRQALGTLQSIGYEADLNNSENLRKIVRRLPNPLRAKWVEVVDKILQSNREPNFSDLTEYIEHRARVINNAYGHDLFIERGTKSDNQKYTQPHKVSTFTTSGEEAPRAAMCTVCGDHHKFWECERLISMSVDERRKCCLEKGLCFNCLGRGHVVASCPKDKQCRRKGCSLRMKHNTLLHPELPPRPPPAEDVNTCTNDNDGETIQMCSTTVISKSVYLRVVPVLIHGNNGTIKTYAMLDQGADVTLCSKTLFNKMGIPGRNKTLSITTINNSQSVPGIEFDVTISPVNGSREINLDNVWTVDRIPVKSSSIATRADIGSCPHLADIELTELEDKSVELLIGANTPEVFFCEEERRGGPKQPYGIRTILGWTVLGPRSKGVREKGSVNFIRCDDTLLNKQVEQFWNTEFSDISEDSKAMSMEDKRSMEIMESTITHVDDHYQVSLPWRAHPAPATLDNNRVLAEARVQSLKRRLLRDKCLKNNYFDIIDDYVKNGYACKITELSSKMENCATPVWYLPHHPVIQQQKGNVRIVFDCAAKFHGKSLNSELMQGPDLSNSLVGVLLNFRKDQIALVSDIKSMFNQVRVSEGDCNALRFLFWEDRDMTVPTEMMMKTQLFGATSSPSICCFALRHTANQNRHAFSEETVKTVYNSFYIDDLLTSVKDVSTAIMLSKELTALLRRGGFKLTKWISNNKEVMESISAKERAPSIVSLDLQVDELPMERALGIQWDVDRDQFRFLTLKITSKPATRRGILSTLSSLFDPLGFLAPVILTAKLILQKLCELRLGWDEVIDKESALKFDKWKERLSSLSTVSIDRCYTPKILGHLNDAELHIFCDASGTAFGAVAYLRVQDQSGNVHCSFVLGKSRLAPLKTVTIPRLELSAAVVGVNLCVCIQKQLTGVNISHVRFWTDSVAVLWYIYHEEKRFKTFVANRVAKIRLHSNPTDWHHVSTKNNPADVASRGLHPNDTQGISRWIQGPEFLRDVGFSMTTSQPIRDFDDAEERTVSMTTTQLDNSEPLSKLLSYYSSWYKLRICVAWLLRFKHFLVDRHLKKPREASLQVNAISVKEIQHATIAIIQLVQSTTYSTELKDLSAGRVVTKSSSLRKLSPIIDNGLILVGGRLNRAPVHFEARHPILLPDKHHVTNIIIQECHLKNGHIGVNGTLSMLRSTYWIVHGRSSVRRVISKCFECKRYTAKHAEQIMAELPEQRLTPDKPVFYNTAVDYFGPLIIKQKRSHVKRYGCLMTCMATRAVHLEIAHTLDTDSFLMALHRFFSRRGRPGAIFSDNGSNFVAGCKELKEQLSTWNQDKICDDMRQKEIEWHFNPPYAAHMGGVWERLVKSTKLILKQLVKEQLLDDESLRTLFAETERIINSRPLTQISTDVKDDMSVLTPNDLLLLRANDSFPSGAFKSTDNYVKRKWHQSQYLSNIFWRRWIREYIPSLQERTKWLSPRRNIEVNDIVLLVDEKVPRGKWPLARVTEAKPDRHGHVRTIKVLCNGRDKCRPITKVVLLERSDD